MKKIFLILTTLLLLTACQTEDAKRANLLPHQLVTSKADMIKMERLNAGVHTPIMYETDSK